MACPFKLWVPPPGAPDITQKLCNWLPRAHGALQDDELGREILADLQQLSKECALLKLLFEIFDCWHTTVHFLRNVAVMASAAANFNFLNWVTGAGGAAKDTLLSIVLTAFGEEGDQLGFCEMGRKLTTAVDQRNSVNPVLDAVRGKRTDLPKMLCEQTGASLRAGKRQQLLTTGLSNKADQSAFDVLEGVVATKSTPDGVDLKLSNYSTTAAMNGSIAVKFFHFVPAKSSEAKPSLRSPFMSGRLYCLASTESKSCKSSATSASAISVFTRLSDKSVKLVLQTTLPVLPAITRQPGFLWFVVRDSCVKRLFVCTSASSLIMMSSHWCTLPSRSRKTRALWLPSSRSSGPLSGAALLLDTCSLLQPAQFFVKKRSSEKSEVLVTGEELRRGDRARARHVAAHHAARRHSAARGREGAVQALAAQRARGGRTGDGQRGARDRPGGCEARCGCCA